MHIKTILNRIQKQRGFVYGTVQFMGRSRGLVLEVDIYPHARNRPRCSGCGRRGPQYDRLPPRQFEFVPLWGIAVFFLYMMRRVDCATCGVRVEQVPWADGKHQLTTTYQWFLARWAKRLSWREVAQVFDTSWDQVFRAVAIDRKSTRLNSCHEWSSYAVFCLKKKKKTNLKCSLLDTRECRTYETKEIIGM